MRRFMLYMVVFLLAALLSACGDDKSKIELSALPPTGDAANGETLYSGTKNAITPCSSCHTVDGREQPDASPTLRNYSEVAGERVDGQDARTYTFWSIVQPGDYLVDGYGNAMPNHYDNKLSPQDIADLIAYLLTL